MTENHSPEEQIKEPVKMQVVMERIEKFEQKTAGFWIRFWAYIADLLILSSIGMLLIKPIFRLFSWEIGNSVWYAPFTLLTAFIFYLYFILMTKLFSQTVGKMIFGIRVIAKDGTKLSWGMVIFREWIGRLISIIPLNLPYLVVAFTPKNQAIHDFIADTLVIYEAAYDKKDVVKYKKVPIITNELQEPKEV